MRTPEHTFISKGAAQAADEARQQTIQIIQDHSAPSIACTKTPCKPKGAWQQLARIEDSCSTHVSHKCLWHVDACAGSVLSPHDYCDQRAKTMRQPELHRRGRVSCGTFLDFQVEHGENLQHCRSHSRQVRVCPRNARRCETRRPRSQHRNLRIRRSDIQTV